MSYKIVAEVGCNHQGSFNRAVNMIERAAIAGADIVKFQKRENRLLLSEEEFNAPHPVPKNSFGETYGAHREFLEFTVWQHGQLKLACEKYGAEYSCSVWDRHAAWEIAQLKPKHIKIPSACNMDFEIYDELEGWDGFLHISLGMTTSEELDQIVERVIPSFEKWNPIFYTCTSGYPVRADETYLLDIAELKEELWNGFEIGFSGHHKGLNLDLAAAALGANYIERHYTFDRYAKGTDHIASLTTDDLMDLRSNLDEVHQAMQSKYEMPSIEKIQRAKLKRKV